MDPQIIDYYNEMPHEVNVIDKMNEELDEVQTKLAETESELLYAQKLLSDNQNEIEAFNSLKMNYNIKIIGYKKKMERRQKGIFKKSGKPKFVNFYIDDSNKPIYGLR